MNCRQGNANRRGVKPDTTAEHLAIQREIDTLPQALQPDQIL
ncbi:hypothetical protein [Thiocapsa sp.]|nr:hypothetical protein [Thiocapsa sp.]HSO84525.1 hypothetical protein [Thiocapsa sp.]